MIERAVPARALLAACAVAASLAGCGKDESSAGAAADAAPRPLARPLARVTVDAGPAEPEAPPIRAGDVLSGPDAEKALATQLTPSIDAGAGAPPELDFSITASGAGPFRIGMTRADVVAHAKSAAFRRVRLPTASTPGIEIATVPSPTTPILQLRLYAGRVIEIEVIRRDPRAATDGEITVGSTFAQAEDEHGEPIRARDSTGALRGWSMSELPGVIFAPANPALLSQETPPPTARIGRLIVGTGSGD